MTAVWATFPQASVAVLQFSATIGDSVTPGTVFANTANLTFTSLPGDITTSQNAFSTVATERTGNIANPGAALNNYRASSSAVT